VTAQLLIPGAQPPELPGSPYPPHRAGPAEPDQAAEPQGLSWSWQLDFGALMECLGGDAFAADDTTGDDPGDPAWETGAASAGCPGGSRQPAGPVAVRVAERLSPGPDLAAWLATAPAASLADHDLVGAASSWRRIASWAQAQELAAVAQLASRAAARDRNTGAAADGRPARVTEAAAAEVALGLAMSQYGAAGWADLAVDLAWRLTATGAALASGSIDLPRARLIADATSTLTDDDARAVEERVLPKAGQQTTASLRAALRRAVIAADPEGAERRRAETERRAQVALYPDEETTSTLAGQRLPTVLAAAAMTRIKAMARALKSSGAEGSMDLLGAQIFIGLLLGTLPLIPPPPGAPPDREPPEDPGWPPSDTPADPGDFIGLDDPGPSDVDSPNPRPDSPGTSTGGPGPVDGTAQAAPPRGWPDLPALIPSVAGPGTLTGPGTQRPPAGTLDLSVPWQTLAGISQEPGHVGRIGPVTAQQACQLAHCAAAGQETIWRVIVTGPAGQAIAVARMSRRRPARTGPRTGTGLGIRTGPGPRTGPRTGPGIRTGPGPRTGTGQAPSRGAGPGVTAGLVGRVTLTIPDGILTQAAPLPPGTPPILTQAFREASRAAARARVYAEADAAAGGCAHLAESPAYRPPPRLKEYVAARDVSCRFPTCRQPAWRGDLDHTIPYDQGGRTCGCNLGGLCRTHHQVKQKQGWSLHQIVPGVFQWVTPGDRRYLSVPDLHPT
jgi:hypothetical protein